MKKFITFSLCALLLTGCAQQAAAPTPPPPAQTGDQQASVTITPPSMSQETGTQQTGGKKSEFDK